jgi:hypothetical protein
MSCRVGVILAPLVVLAAIATAVATRFVEPIESTSAGYLPTEAHPWWPDGTTNETLVLFLAAQLGLGLAAFLRRPHSGARRPCSPALLATLPVPLSGRSVWDRPTSWFGRRAGRCSS